MKYLTGMLILILIILSAVLLNSGSFYETANPDPEIKSGNTTFNKFISGVNCAYVETESDFDQLFSDDSLFIGKYYSLVRNYLNSVGFKTAAISKQEQYDLSVSTPLNRTAVFKIIIDHTENYITKISISFTSCNGDNFKFSKNCDYYKNLEWDSFIYESLRELYNDNISFNPDNSLVLRSIPTKWNEALLREYVSNSTDKLEGIYEKYGASDSESKYKIALIKDEDLYNIIYLDGANNPQDWVEGEKKGNFTLTAIRNFYRGEWILSDKSVTKDVYLSTDEENFLKFEFLNKYSSFNSKYLKIYPTNYKSPNSQADFVTSGTGFLVNRSGYIVTNYHVISGSKKINVEFTTDEGINTFSASQLYADIKNDLSVLKIENLSDFHINELPYKITENEVDQGSDVFTLGYPMVELMGESVKLSTGIISSNSGYMGNNKTYQVSVPVNPGNSGGPLFDMDGNLVGIVNARNKQADGVSYAIKSSVLIEFLDRVKIEKNIPKNNISSSERLTSKVKTLNKFVCLVKTY